MRVHPCTSVFSVAVLHERSDGRERCEEECGQLNRFCDVEDGRSTLPVPFSCGACKPGYRQEKIREQYKEECLTNSGEAVNVVWIGGGCLPISSSRSRPNKHKTLTQCWFHVGPASKTPGPQ